MNKNNKATAHYRLLLTVFGAITGLLLVLFAIEYFQSHLVPFGRIPLILISSGCAIYYLVRYRHSSRT